MYKLHPRVSTASATVESVENLCTNYGILDTDLPLILGYTMLTN